MTWNWYNEDIIKAEGDILSSLDKKQKKGTQEKSSSGRSQLNILDRILLDWVSYWI